MPIYRFAVRREDDHDADVRWTHLPDKETARRFANLLIKEFVSSGRSSDSTRTRLEVKDDTGRVAALNPVPAYRLERDGLKLNRHRALDL
jgi:hypothetical protein